ncbi:MAG: ribulose-phosphate 3-epimerase [Deltaproteobacteria bacterium]|nr:MAG: ribulose-phosphate 3-epimerase [Deltaproteobacteria bacterium]
MKRIAPSILSADFSRLGEEVRAVEAAGADYVHIDVMDGHFVPNITIGPLIVEAVRKVTCLPLDVHLMINNPDEYLEDFVQAGSDLIGVHVEVVPHLHRTVQRIKELGAMACVVLNPTTSLDTLEYILGDVDMVLIMTVNPGFGGQKFITGMLEKIKRLRDIIDTKGLEVDLQVDGGINANTIADVAKAGADIFVAGSAIFGSGDYCQTIKRFREIIAGAT